MCGRERKYLCAAPPPCLLESAHFCVNWTTRLIFVLFASCVHYFLVTFNLVLSEVVYNS